jgi:hypothetical protein
MRDNSPFVFGFLMLVIVIGIGVLAEGCATDPSSWTPSEHHQTMSHCRATCGDGFVRSYQPFTGECKCHLSD